MQELNAEVILIIFAMFIFASLLVAMFMFMFGFSNHKREKEHESFMKNNEQFNSEIKEYLRKILKDKKC